MELWKLLEEMYRDGGLYSYVKPLLAVLISFFSLLFLVRFLSARLKRFAANTANTLDDLLAQLLEKTHRFVLFAVSVYIGSHFIELGDEAGEIREEFITAVLVFQVASWMGRIVHHYMMHSYEKWGLTVTQAKVSIFFLRLVLWILAVLVLFENLGIRVTPLIAGLGIGGIAVALAVQSILGEIIASLSIIIDKPFVVGDFIVVGNFRGEVEKVGLKTTRIRSISGELIVFSNNDLVNSTIQNYRNLPRRRSFSTLGVVYETGGEKLGQIPLLIKDIIDKHPKTEYERAHFVEFGDFSLNFEVAYYVLTSNYITYLDTRQEINLEIIKTFRIQNIEFAYPTQTLLAGKQLEVAVKN